MRVLTIGTFDLLHYGHIRLLERAAEFGELHVGVNSDAFVSAYKTRAPAVREAHRLYLVDALKCVTRTYLNDGPGIDLIRRVQPSLIVIGSDWHECHYLKQLGVSSAELDVKGCGVVYLPRTPGVSTTELRA